MYLPVISPTKKYSSGRRILDTTKKYSSGRRILDESNLSEKSVSDIPRFVQSHY
jgi:hypothetical protein